ncbi:MAG: glycosyltransferase [Coriobacteriia bacterium]|nr:glycosyltransferase [Coriobacteriia bacterium]
MGQPLLSVLISVYNHEKYIEECLRSIAAQKTTFDFEVLVGEDCSTDGTRALLQRLQAELPSNFVFLFREQNMGAVANGEDLYARSRGKYLVDFEGDDFMVYEGKFQQQVDFLEEHPEYTVVYTNCSVVGNESEPLAEGYPQCLDDDYSYKENFYSVLPGHSGTSVCRREEYFAMRDKFMALKSYGFYPGDRRNAFMFLTMGKVRCIQQPWSVYRHVTKGGSSYSANLKKDRKFAENEVEFGRTLVAFADNYGDAEAQHWARMNLFRFRLRWCFSSVKLERFGVIWRDARKEQHSFALLCSYLRWGCVLLTRVLRGRTIV